MEDLILVEESRTEGQFSFARRTFCQDWRSMPMFRSYWPPKKLKLKQKTQAKNSRKKLNCREDFTSNLENSRKKLKFPLKTQNFLRGGTIYVIFINKIFQKMEFFESFVSIFFKI